MGDAVMRLLADGALARRLAAAGLQSVRGNAWDQVAPKLAALYRSVLGSRLQGAANPI
jgi:hypothetical protein